MWHHQPGRHTQVILQQLLQSCTRYRYKRDKEDINQLASVLRYREVDSQWGKASQLVINWQVERPC